jgi:DNA-binding transcriptional LysR family regulator
MLDVRRLALLHELALRGTLVGVAESMHLSPSAVSQQLSLLEREVGRPLLRKSGRGVQLTADAEVLVSHTQELLNVLERAEADLRSSALEVFGTVRVAVFQSAALTLMPAALTQLRTDYPLLRVEMTQHEPETALRDTWARRYDIVVAEQYPGHAAPHHAGLDRELLTVDPLRLALSSADSGGALPDMSGRPWVMEPQGAASRHWAEQMCRTAGFEPDVRYESADLQVHIALVRSGNAVALLPDLIWQGAQPTCAIAPLPGEPCRSIFTSVRDAGRREPGISALRGALEDTVSSLESIGRHSA